MLQLIDRIRSRCVDCGDCWIWHGAVGGGRATKHPQMKINGKVCYVRREVYVAAYGEIPKGRNVARTCESALCVNPAHLAAQTVSKIQKRVAATGVYSTPARGKKIAASKRAAFGKLTEDQVREIRESDVPAKHLAERFGICPSNASSIRRGERWKDYSNPFAALM